MIAFSQNLFILYSVFSGKLISVFILLSPSSLTPYFFSPPHYSLCPSQPPQRSLHFPCPHHYFPPPTTTVCLFSLTHHQILRLVYVYHDHRLLSIFSHPPSVKSCVFLLRQPPQSLSFSFYAPQPLSFFFHPSLPFKTLSFFSSPPPQTLSFFCHPLCLSCSTHHQCLYLSSSTHHHHSLIFSSPTTVIFFHHSYYHHHNTSVYLLQP